MGSKRFIDWLEGNDGVVIRADGKPALMVIPLEDYIRLVDVRQPQ
jgi:PHD/YefM family antitoxin component YafN of YafNO toxin-antitoxin module